MNIYELPVHPAADVFPMLDTDELSDLAADIQSNGLQHPIVVGIVDGVEMLIDGRNRLAACKLAKVEPEIKQLNGQDPEALILSENIMRRHMTKGQRAMAVAMMYPEGEKGGRGKTSDILSQVSEYQRKQISQARTVLKYAPHLIDKIMNSDPETKKPLESLGSAYAYAVYTKKQQESEEETKERNEREREDVARMLGKNPADRDIEEKFREGSLSTDVAKGMLATREEERRTDRQGWWDTVSQIDSFTKILGNNSIDELAEIYQTYGSETDVDVKKMADKFAVSMKKLSEML